MTHAVHQLGERAVRVPAAPFLMELRKRRKEILEGSDTPRSWPCAVYGSGLAALYHSRQCRIWCRPVEGAAGSSVTVSQETLSLLQKREQI